MNPEDKVIDFCLSLIYAGKNLEEYKEYKDLLKAIDTNYLKAIKEYQLILQEQCHLIDYFVNEEYNVLSYILILQHIPDFEALKSYLTNVSKEDFFQVISTHILEKKTPFSTQDLLEVSLEEKNKWKLTELFYKYTEIKDEFLEVIENSWQQYSSLVTSLEQHFQSKIAQEKRRLAEKSDNLYSVVYRDYITKEDYETSENNHLLLVSFQKIMFTKMTKSGSLGLGLFAYDYLRFVKSTNNYNQESREKILKILADPTRFGILKFIIEGVSSNKIIANKFGISSAAVSYQLKNLLDNKIILIDPNSRKYTLNKELLKHTLIGIEKELSLD
ncbi:ArsR/SmtB family transcription factor [Streptococcus merionis]|uniref:ArsR/SmtB family transcription factor n=1 Tax=Streptococcus merionis TaxID=400065 RepID=UPI0035132463